MLKRALKTAHYYLIKSNWCNCEPKAWKSHILWIKSTKWPWKTLHEMQLSFSPFRIPFTCSYTVSLCTRPFGKNELRKEWPHKRPLSNIIKPEYYFKCSGLCPCSVYPMAIPFCHISLEPEICEIGIRLGRAWFASILVLIKCMKTASIEVTTAHSGIAFSTDAIAVVHWECIGRVVAYTNEFLLSFQIKQRRIRCFTLTLRSANICKATTTITSTRVIR